MVTRTGNATILSFFPGFNENSSEGGDELNSVIPDFGGYAMDDWFHGDFREEKELDYTTATAKNRDLEEYTENFHHYRQKNRTEVSFNTPDNQTIDSNSVTVTYNTDRVDVTLEGEDNALRDPSVQSALGITQNKVQAGAKPRYHNWKIGTVNNIDALHTTSIWGGFDPYVVDMINYARDNGIENLIALLLTQTEVNFLGSLTGFLIAHILGTPAIWSWQEYTLLADGTELVRVWDVSQYPEHAGYLGDNWQATAEIEWQANQNINEAFVNWGAASRTPTNGPYQAVKSVYKAEFNGDNLLPTSSPVMAYGRDENRTDPELSASEVNTMLGEGFAVDPFGNRETY